MARSMGGFEATRDEHDDCYERDRESGWNKKWEGNVGEYGDWGG